MVLVLSSTEVRAALPMREAIRSIEEGFRALGAGRAFVPKRLVVPVEEFGGSLLCMPAYITDQEALAVKAVSVYPRNQEMGRPTVSAVAILLDPRTGEPLAMIEGGSLTAIRTGAAAGIATKRLAVDGARRVGVFGAGAVGRAAVEAVKEVLGDPVVKVYDVVRARAERCAREISRNLEISASVASDPRDAASGADVIVTATTSETPVFDGRCLESGAHVNAMGSHSPDAREIDTATLLRARGRIVLDSKEACMAEAGDILIPMAEGAIRESDIFGELGEVIAKGKAVRRSDRDVTLFKSVGVAVQDAAAAAAVYKIAKAAGIGREIQL
ncbi:MAG: ornithine cyclodeaminase family protein [Candidatus Methanosuratincola verstraetei]